MVLGGTAAFLALQYIIALWRLTQSSGAMANKFSALAREEYLGFLIRENLLMLIAYALLALAAAALAHPAITLFQKKTRFKAHRYSLLGGFAIAATLHGYCTLRLVNTRPYFINEAEFGRWYYQLFELIPEAIQPASFFLIFTALPLACIIAAIAWHAHRHGRRGWITLAALVTISGCAIGIASIDTNTEVTASTNEQPNIIIIGSDSLRGDRLGCSGYTPSRNDGLAAGGVSPAIDALAAKSIQFEACYTPIASTLESGVSLMSSQYPHTHGIRQMYPDQQTVDSANANTNTIASKLRAKGYDTAAIGDWCAGYYKITPLGMEHISVSSFDNFKIYMSQAVVMAHFVIPLYFDNSLGYELFPQLNSFAQFVTPDVVTKRVDQRLNQVAAEQKPFFWHVFFSCNHLPYRTAEPYNSMFADPDYEGPNRSGVDFDIDSFIGGTDLESKWKALPAKEITQIRALYDGCTREFDYHVGEILKSLERTGHDKNTIVIITADHGDDHYEPGVTLGHGLTFNGGLQSYHVPLIIHVPGADPKKIPETVRTIDIAPTIAELAGLNPKQKSWEGQSFAKWITGEATPTYRPFYGETGFPFIQFTVPGVERPPLPPMDECTFIDEDYNYQFVVKPEFRDRITHAKQRCLMTKDWRLVCTPTAQGTRHFGLFHSATDPYSRTDVAADHPEVLAPMQVAMEKWMDQGTESSISEIFPHGEP